jgi:hypothetical protein
MVERRDATPLVQGRLAIARMKSVSAVKGAEMKQRGRVDTSGSRTWLAILFAAAQLPNLEQTQETERWQSCEMTTSAEPLFRPPSRFGGDSHCPWSAMPRRPTQVGQQSLMMISCHVESSLQLILYVSMVLILVEY